VEKLRVLEEYLAKRLVKDGEIPLQSELTSKLSLSAAELKTLDTSDSVLSTLWGFKSREKELLFEKLNESPDSATSLSRLFYIVAECQLEAAVEAVKNIGGGDGPEAA